MAGFHTRIGSPPSNNFWPGALLPTDCVSNPPLAVSKKPSLAETTGRLKLGSGRGSRPYRAPAVEAEFEERPLRGANCKFEIVRLNQHPGGPYYNRTTTGLKPVRVSCLLLLSTCEL
jgi:hypothetical protein